MEYLIRCCVFRQNSTYAGQVAKLLPADRSSCTTGMIFHFELIRRYMGIDVRTPRLSDKPCVEALLLPLSIWIYIPEPRLVLLAGCLIDFSLWSNHSILFRYFSSVLSFFKYTPSCCPIVRFSLLRGSQCC